MEEEVRFYLMAGVHARERWNIKAETLDIVEVPTSPCMVSVWDDPPNGSMEKIHLEKFVDKMGHSIRMGYGPRANVLAVKV